MKSAARESETARTIQIASKYVKIFTFWYSASRIYKVVVGAPRDFKTENMFIEEIDWLAGCASDVTIECDMICFRDLLKL